MKRFWRARRDWDLIICNLLIAVVFLATAAGLTLTGVLLYKAITDPCHCIEEKCQTVMAATLIGKTVVATPQVQCECLKKVCPAEKP